MTESPAPEFKGIVAEYYEKYYSPILFTQPAKDLVSRLPKDLSAILELACGTGQVTRLMRAKYPNAKITATDLNPDMITVAKKMVIGKGIDWKTMDAQEISFEDNSFDAVVCQFGVMFFPDKQKSVNEVYRVLKPGGSYLFSTWDKIANQRTSILTRDVIISFFKDDPPTFFDIPFSMYDKAIMEELMKNAGFKDVSVKNVLLEGTSQSAGDAAKGFTMGNPVYFSICERDESMLPEITETIKKKFAAEFGDNQLRIPLSLWVTEGKK
jgi:ubiquinone/menaquinone biosynthesis C-methylase UbiE